MDQSACSNCHLQVLPVFYFCPNCGKSLRSKPLSTSIGKQIGIYALSFFLPPLGLVPGIKYLLQKNVKAKVVGGVGVLLTIISAVVTISLAMNLFVQVRSQLDSQLNTQLQNAQPQTDQLSF